MGAVFHPEAAVEPPGAAGGRTAGCRGRRARRHEFHPDTAELFREFEENGEQASAAGYIASDFSALVLEMVNRDLHLVSNGSRELDQFRIEAEKERDLLRHAAEEKKQAFHIAKSIWIELQEDLGRTLLMEEDARLRNANVRHDWLLVFGDVFLPYQEAATRTADLRRRIRLKEMHPEFSEEQLAQQVREDEMQAQQRLADLRLQASMRRHRFRGPPMDPQEWTKHRRQCQEAISELFRLAHSDGHRISKLMFTDAQARRLTEILGSAKQYKRLMRIRPNETTEPEGTIAYDQRCLTEILRIRDEARKILEHAGLCTDVSLIVGGETLEEQITWLRDASHDVQEAILNTCSRISALTSDPATLGMQRDIDEIEDADLDQQGRGQRISAIKARISQGREAAEKQELELQQHLSRLFANENAVAQGGSR